MNTPPRRRRHTPKTFPSDQDLGGYLATLSDERYATRLANVAVEFVHLENAMATVLAVLLGQTQIEAAGYVLRSIKSPANRVAVMKTLLEDARWNEALGDEYDEIIRSFSDINSRRNKYVHGMWWTHAANGSVLFASENVDGLGFMRAAPLAVDELDRLRDDIRSLGFKIMLGPLMGPDGIVERRRRIGIQPPFNANGS